MADYRAIASVCEAVADLLRNNYRKDYFDHELKHELQFQVYTRDDFATAMEAGVSVFLYRIYHSGVNRLPPGARGPYGEPKKPQLPVDLHFLLTAWGRAASLQNTIAGWMMRVMEDNPVLQPGLLNHKWSAFSHNETVEISLAKVSTEDIFRIWDTLIQDKYQLSVPYFARDVRIDSKLDKKVGSTIHDREFQFVR